MDNDGVAQLALNNRTIFQYDPLPYFLPTSPRTPPFFENWADLTFFYQTVYEQHQRLQAIIRPLVSSTTWEKVIGASQRGERKLPAESPQLSILRLDIANFTGLMASQSPDQILADLGNYLDRLTQIVYSHEGDIDKYLGDGFLALFPSADEAVQAGCALQQAIIEFNQDQAAHGRSIFPTRIGIDSGSVTITSLGSSQRQERTVIGLAVIIAERLQALATAGQVWLSQATFEQLQDQGDCRCLGPIEVKGLATPVVVYEMTLTGEEERHA